MLALSLPVFVAAGLPLLGWGAATGAWLASRFVQSRVERGAAATGDRRSAMRARAIALVGRLYLVGVAY